MLPFKVSILICAHNEDKNISGLLVSLAHQSQFHCIDEIILADNNSSDMTFEKSVAIGKDYNLPLKVISLKSNNIGRARNILVERAKSEFVAFVDADCRLKPNWLESLCNHYLLFSKDNPKLVGVGGPNRLPGKSTFQKTVNKNLDKSWLHGFSPQGYTKKNHALKVDHIPTTNALFQRMAIIECGNFSNKYNRVGEDLDIGLRLNKKGGQLLMNASPLVENNCAENLVQWGQRMFNFGKAQGLTLGRRKNIVTLFLLTCCLAIFFLSQNSQWLPEAGILAVCILIIMARPLSGRPSLVLKSYFIAFGLWATTPLCYFLGFLWGTYQKATATLFRAATSLSR